MSGVVRLRNADLFVHRTGCPPGAKASALAGRPHAGRRSLFHAGRPANDGRHDPQFSRHTAALNPIPSATTAAAPRRPFFLRGVHGRLRTSIVTHSHFATMPAESGISGRNTTERQNVVQGKSGSVRVKIRRTKT